MWNIHLVPSNLHSCPSTRLMAGSWKDQVLLSEERNYDFDFLITILMYWKKEKGHPSPAEKSEASELKATTVNQKKTMGNDHSLKSQATGSKLTLSSAPGLKIAHSSGSKAPHQVPPMGVSSVQEKATVPDKAAALTIPDRSPVAITTIHAQTMAEAQKPSVTGSLSVLALHQVKSSPG